MAGNQGANTPGVDGVTAAYVEEEVGVPGGEPTLRTITIQADKPLDAIMEQWLAHLVLAIPVGPDGIKFDGDLSNGTTVNQRTEGQWTVSFRPNPDGSRRRAYSNPYVVARVIIAGEHETVANLPARDVTAVALRGTRVR